MNKYAIVLTPEATKDIRHLDVDTATRILDKLAWMGKNAELLRHQSLRANEWSGCFKYRVGDYRIIYQVNQILKVGHREQIYK